MNRRVFVMTYAVENSIQYAPNYALDRTKLFCVNSGKFVKNICLGIGAIRRSSPYGKKKICSCRFLFSYAYYAHAMCIMNAMPMLH